MPRRRGEGLEHTRASRRAQEAAVRGLVADVVTEAHEAHAAAQRDPTGSARAFLSEAVLPAVCALNGASATTLLPAMHRIVNAARPGLISPEAALYGHWMDWRTSKRSGRALSMGDTLRLTGGGSAMSLHSSAPALLHALRTRCPGDTAPYLNQARAMYPGGVSELTRHSTSYTCQTRTWSGRSNDQPGVLKRYPEPHDHGGVYNRSPCAHQPHVRRGRWPVKPGERPAGACPLP